MTKQFFHKLLHEPLLHFLLIGAGLFLLFNQLADTETESAQRIVITQADLDQLAATWLRAKGRPPSTQERERQLRQFVREQVLYREAMAMGLDKDDVIVRRRLARKMAYLFDDLSVIPEPTNTELADYLTGHPEQFVQPARITFQQIYLDPRTHEQDMTEVAEQLLQQLLQDENRIDPVNLGDRSLLPFRFTGESKNDISNLFGTNFAGRIFSLPVANWQGPVLSEYGGHLVYIEERTEAHVPVLAEVKPQVAREWLRVKQAAANEVFYRSLYQRYEIVLDGVAAEIAAGVKK
jgi:hypothetical protein